MLHEYAALHAPAAARVGRYVMHEPAFGAVFALWRQHPETDFFVVGETARDAVMGRVPRNIHVVTARMPLLRLRGRAARMGKLTSHGEHSFSLTPKKSGSSLTFSLPKTDVYHSRLHRLEERYLEDGAIENDLMSRDFTINGLAYSIGEGRLYDPLRGLSDLQAGRLVAIGDPAKRFAQRPLHALRAFRLRDELAFVLEEKTEAAARQALPLLGQTHLAEKGSSSEFVTPFAQVEREILHHFFVRPSRALRSVRALPSSHQALLPFSASAFGLLEQAEEAFHDDAFRKRHGLTVLTPSVALLLFVSSFEDAAHDTLESLAPLLRRHGHGALVDSTRQALSRAALLKTDPRLFSTHTFLTQFGSTAGRHALAVLHALHRESGLHGPSRAHVNTALRREERLRHATLPEPLVRGRDLVQAGFAPGAHMRTLLKAIAEAQYQGEIFTKSDALAFARQLAW